MTISISSIPYSERKIFAFSANSIPQKSNKACAKQKEQDLMENKQSPNVNDNNNNNNNIKKAKSQLKKVDKIPIKVKKKVVKKIVKVKKKPLTDKKASKKCIKKINSSSTRHNNNNNKETIAGADATVTKPSKSELKKVIKKPTKKENEKSKINKKQDANKNSKETKSPCAKLKKMSDTSSLPKTKDKLTIFKKQKLTSSSLSTKNEGLSKKSSKKQSSLKLSSMSSPTKETKSISKPSSKKVKSTTSSKPLTSTTTTTTTIKNKKRKTSFDILPSNESTATTTPVKKQKVSHSTSPTTKTLAEATTLKPKTKKSLLSDTKLGKTKKKSLQSKPSNSKSSSKVSSTTAAATASSTSTDLGTKAATTVPKTKAISTSPKTTKVTCKSSKTKPTKAAALESKTSSTDSKTKTTFKSSKLSKTNSTITKTKATAATSTQTYKLVLTSPNTKTTSKSPKIKQSLSAASKSKALPKGPKMKATCKYPKTKLTTTETKSVSTTTAPESKTKSTVPKTDTATIATKTKSTVTTTEANNKPAAPNATTTTLEANATFTSLETNEIPTTAQRNSTSIAPNATTVTLKAIETFTSPEIDATSTTSDSDDASMITESNATLSFPEAKALAASSLSTTKETKAKKIPKRGIPIPLPGDGNIRLTNFRRPSSPSPQRNTSSMRHDQKLVTQSIAANILEAVRKEAAKATEKITKEEQRKAECSAKKAERIAKWAQLHSHSETTDMKSNNTKVDENNNSNHIEEDNDEEKESSLLITDEETTEMPPTTLTENTHKESKNFQKKPLSLRFSKAVYNALAKEIVQATEGLNRSAKVGLVSSIVDSAKVEFPWLQNEKIEKAIHRRRKLLRNQHVEEGFADHEMEEELKVRETETDTDPVPVPELSEEQIAIQKKRDAVYDELTEKVMTYRKEHSFKRLPHGWMVKAIEDSCIEHGIDKSHVKENSVTRRLLRHRIPLHELYDRETILSELKHTTKDFMKTIQQFYVTLKSRELDTAIIFFYFWKIYDASEECAISKFEKNPDPTVLLKPMKELLQYQDMYDTSTWADDEDGRPKMIHLIKLQLQIVIEKSQEWDSRSWQSHRGEILDWKSLSPTEWTTIFSSLLLLSYQEKFRKNFAKEIVNLEHQWNKFQLFGFETTKAKIFRCGSCGHQSCSISTITCVKCGKKEIKRRNGFSLFRDAFNAIIKHPLDEEKSDYIQQPKSLSNESHWGHLSWLYCEAMNKYKNKK